MSRAAANGNGNGNGHQGRAGTATIDPATLGTLAAPERLGAALTITGNNVRAAMRLLKSAGAEISVTSGKHDQAEDGDGLYAPHPVNVTQAGFSYSAQGSPGHEACCANRPRGLYQGTRHAGDLPHVHARIMTREGRTSTAAYLMSARPGCAPALVTWDDIDRGRVPHRLNMAAPSRDGRIRDAHATVLFALAYDPEVAERPAALAPSSRTPDGHIPAPAWEALPPGYGDQPTAPEAARLAARSAQADIAGACPQIALSWGASVAAPYVGALRVQTAVWETVGRPRTGKTTTVQLQASAWGSPAFPPDPGILASWDATSKGFGRMLGILGILPAFMDESATAGFTPVEWARTVFSTTSGASRLMAETQGPGMRRTPGWQGFAFVSGNGSIADGNTAGQFAGVAARVITLTGPFTADAGQARQLRAAIETDHGHVGPAVLAAVDVPQMRAWYDAAREAIGAPDGGTLGTTGEQLAAAVAGAVAIDHVLGTGNRIGAAAARAARDYLGTVAEPESDRERVLRKLAEMLSSNRPAWPDREAYEALGQPHPGIAAADQIPRHGYVTQLDGLRDETWLYIYPTTWDRVSAETGITVPLVLRELHAAGALAVPPSLAARGQWRAMAPRWAGPARSPVYKVRLSALAGDDSGDGHAPDVDGHQDRGPDVDGHQDRGPDVDGHQDQATAPATEPGPADPWDTERAAMEAYQQHQLPAAPAPAPALVAPEAPAVLGRDEWLAAAFAREDNTRYFRTEPERAALKRIVTLLDENPDRADKDAVRSLTTRLQLLSELEGTGKQFGGPFLPKLRGRPMLLMPWKKDGLPIAAELARVIEGYDVQRDYRGEVVAFDRNGAWLGSIGTTPVAHGALSHTGECEPAASGTQPGYYLVNVYRWPERDMPAPLGTAEPGSQVWIPAPVMGLLAELAAAGRWPDATAADSWTGEPVRMLTWGRLIRETRRYALETYGYGSGAYQAAKDAFSTAVSLMNGTLADDSTQPVRVWRKCKTQRIDHRHQVISASAAGMWRTLDRCRQLAGEDPALAPVGIRNKDELLIPAAAVELVTTRPYPGGDRPAVRVDESGVTLGTFKIKSREDW